MFSNSLPTTGSPKRRIGLYVTLVHILLIGWYGVTATPKEKKGKRHAVTVTTHVLTPTVAERARIPTPARNPPPSGEPPQIATAQTTPSHVTPTEVAPNHPPPTKPSSPKSGNPKPQKKTERSSSPSTPQQALGSARQAELVKQMEASLSSLQSLGTPPAPSAAAGPVRSVGALASESLSVQTPTYYDRLISLLETRLILPEAGDVKVLLTIARNGTIQELVIKESASTRNRAYIEQQLPLLPLPPLDGTFKAETKHTFTITLTSA